MYKVEWPCTVNFQLRDANSHIMFHSPSHLFSKPTGSPLQETVKWKGESLKQMLGFIAGIGLETTPHIF